MKVVTQKDVQLINDLYLQLHTYAAVARSTGFSPSTVKKYVKQDYQPIIENTIIHFQGDLPENFMQKVFLQDDWQSLCILSDQEREEVHELWKELTL